MSILIGINQVDGCVILQWSKKNTMLLAHKGKLETTPKTWTMHYQCEIQSGELKASQFPEFCKERRKALRILGQQIRLRKKTNNASVSSTKAMQV